MNIHLSTMNGTVKSPSVDPEVVPSESSIQLLSCGTTWKYVICLFFPLYVEEQWTYCQDYEREYLFTDNAGQNKIYFNITT